MSAPIRTSSPWLKFLIAAIAVATMWLMYPTFLHWWISVPVGPREPMGLHGDGYGGLNTFFSGLAFAALVITLFLQREELALQRDELRLQREETKRSREELARSASAQERSQELMLLNTKLIALSSLSASQMAICDKLGSLHSDIRSDKLDHPTELFRSAQERIFKISQELERLEGQGAGPDAEG